MKREKREKIGNSYMRRNKEDRQSGQSAKSFGFHLTSRKKIKYI